MGQAGVVVGAAIVRGRRVLAAQRAYPPEIAGQWELPGGRVEPPESDQDAVRRECAEELAVDVHVGGRVGADVPLPGGKVLRIYAASLTDEAREPIAKQHRGLRWLPAGELDTVEWLPADRELLPALSDLLSQPDEG